MLSYFSFKMFFVILYRVCAVEINSVMFHVFFVKSCFPFVSHFMLSSGRFVKTVWRTGLFFSFFFPSCCFDVEFRVFQVIFLSIIIFCQKPRFLWFRELAVGKYRSNNFYCQYFHIYFPSLGWSLLLPAIILSRGFRIRPFLLCARLCFCVLNSSLVAVASIKLLLRNRCAHYLT